jgi:transposase
VEVPKEMYLVFLPPYSPNMQPAERLWPIVNEGIAKQVLEPLDALLERVAQRCVELLKLPNFISGLPHFHWWEAFQH